MGYIGKDRANDDTPNWFTTAPTAAEEPQEDKVTLHSVYYNAEGIACCEGAEGENSHG